MVLGCRLSEICMVDISSRLNMSISNLGRRDGLRTMTGVISREENRIIQCLIMRSLAEQYLLADPVIR